MAPRQVVHRSAERQTLDRPDLQRALAEARLGSYELLLVHKVDRLARSVRRLAQILEDLDAVGVAFMAEHGRAVGILWYEQPEDLDGITQLVGTWFQDHIAPRLAGPETAMRGRVVVNMTPPHTAKT